MGIKNKLLVCGALLGFLFLACAESASAAVDFPADEAGISAYVRANESINLSDVKPVFATIEREDTTAGYIIGTVAMSLHSEEQYPHLYVSTDGWVVAYYPNDRPSSWLLPWAYYSGGPITTTTLNEAVKIVCDEINGSATGLKYYDFRHPDATQMMIIVESTTGSNWFNIYIPTTFTTYRVDWSHYCYDCYYMYGYYPSRAYLDGSLISDIRGTNVYKYDSFNLSTQFPNGEEHQISITAERDTPRIGLVLEYAE
jgi:hypothetical protein